MNFELRLNNISLNARGVMRDIIPHLRHALDEAEKWLIEFMQEAIDETSTAPKDWRDQLKNDLHHVSDEVLNNQIRYSTGVDYVEGAGAWMRAMVIAYGMGIYGLNGNRITAGPRGRIVWDGELNAQIHSSVENEHEIPMGWYHAGGWFIHNAISNMRSIYRDIIEDALENMPASVFSRNIRITRRR